MSRRSCTRRCHDYAEDRSCKLGAGTFGTYAGVAKATQRPVAIKRILVDPDDDDASTPAVAAARA